MESESLLIAGFAHVPCHSSWSLVSNMKRQCGIIKSQQRKVCHKPIGDIESVKQFHQLYVIGPKSPAEHRKFSHGRNAFERELFSPNWSLLRPKYPNESEVSTPTKSRCCTLKLNTRISHAARRFVCVCKYFLMLTQQTKHFLSVFPFPPLAVSSLASRRSSDFIRWVHVGAAGYRSRRFFRMSFEYSGD